MRHVAVVAAAAAVGVLAAAGPQARAEVRTFTISANGAKEVTAAGVPNQGDPDGTALGTIRFDNGTGSGSTGSAVFDLSLLNIDGTLSGHHIHQAPATSTGGIVVDFGNPNTILSGSPSSGTLSGTVTGLPAATITNIFNSPAGFYYNLHSTPNFPAGAVRDQLPEPSSLALLGLGGLALLVRRRKP